MNSLPDLAPSIRSGFRRFAFIAGGLLIVLILLELLSRPEASWAGLLQLALALAAGVAGGFWLQ